MAARGDGSGDGGGGGRDQPLEVGEGDASAWAGAGARGGTYGREEVSALKGIFSLYDAENTGTIGVKELEGILQKVGHSPGEPLALLGSQSVLCTSIRLTRRSHTKPMQNSSVLLLYHGTHPSASTKWYRRFFVPPCVYREDAE